MVVRGAYVEIWLECGHLHQQQHTHTHGFYYNLLIIEFAEHQHVLNLEALCGLLGGFQVYE
jgi:hypothetical protein